MVGMRAAADVEKALENIILCQWYAVVCLLLHCSPKRQIRESKLPEEVIIVVEYNVGMSAYYAPSLRAC